MIGSVTNRMEAVSSTATKSEKKLMEGLRTIEINTLVSLSITELAARLNVAESTISRFCKKLDYKGFQDFKLGILHEFGRDISGTEGYHAEIAQKMHEAIEETYADIQPEKCEVVARRILSAKRVCIFGVSNSSISANALRLKLVRAGVFAEHYTDTHFQKIAAKHLCKDDFLILFCASGNTEEIIAVAETAKASGVPTAVITGYNKSKIAEFADFLILASRKEVRFEEVSLATVVAQIYAADVISAAVERLQQQETFLLHGNEWL